MKLWCSTLKRPVDIAVAAVALLALLPVFGAVAVLVYLTLGSPVLYRELRIGRGGKQFTLYKFRTMTNAQDTDGRLLPDAERMTRTGRVLRATSLDELPELWNVLCGDMSLVGPRPLPERYRDRFTPEEFRRHEVRPGLTGLAQVKGRNRIEWDERLALDLWYVEHCSGWLDAKIALTTVRVVVGRRGVRPLGSEVMAEFRPPLSDADGTK